MTKKLRDPILFDVFKAFGGAAKLAHQLNVTRQSVSQWNQVPLKHVRMIARMTGLTPAELRPDIYGDL